VGITLSKNMSNLKSRKNIFGLFFFAHIFFFIFATLNNKLLK